MTEKQSSKTVSIRTKGDAEELFKEIAKDFDSQDEAFRSLLAAYNREHKKDDLSEHRDKIESLKGECSGLRKSLEEYQKQSTEDEDTLLKIDGELKSKELEAKSLQGDIKVLETKLDSESKTSQSLSADIESLKEEIKAYKKSISEKDEYIKELNTKLLENKENKGM